VTEPGSAILSNKWVVPEGAVLLSKLNPRIPRVWFPRLNSARRSICSTEFFPLLPNEGFSPEFLYCLCACQSFTEEFATMTTGTSGSHQRVRPDFAAAIEIAVPPPDVVSNFTDIVRPLLHRVKTNREEATTLAALRETLLPRLLSGEIRVPEARQTLITHT
jgi:type I restriction enzyme S subunit